jgi:hypothetical protein
MYLTTGPNVSDSVKGQAGAGRIASAPFLILSTALHSEACAHKALDALEDANYVCVPREPTPVMLKAGWAPAHDEDADDTWRAMVEASQS